MQPDRYIKIVLTVIAAALVVLVIQGAVSRADAQGRGAVQRVAICSETGRVCMPVMEIRDLPVLGVVVMNVPLETQQAPSTGGR